MKLHQSLPHPAAIETPGGNSPANERTLKGPEQQACVVPVKVRRRSRVQVGPSRQESEELLRAAEATGPGASEEPAKQDVIGPRLRDLSPAVTNTKTLFSCV